MVPQGTSACVPAAICRSTSATNAFSSTFPLRKGVTRAGMEPLKTMGFSGTRDEVVPRDSRDNHSMRGFGKHMSRTGRALMAAVALSALGGAVGAGVAMANQPGWIRQISPC